MIKVLLFDADGVLFFHTDKLFSDRLIADYGVDPVKMEYFFTTIFPECLVGNKDIKQELTDKLDDWGWPGTTEELMEYWYSYEHNIDEPLIDYIRRLRQSGIPSFVATNNDHYRAECLFNNLNIDETVFDKLYAAGDMGVAKPEVTFFQQILDDLDAYVPNEILFWDDSLVNVEAAKAMGLQAELYTTFKDFEQRMKQYE
jgi:putative hydrolase of the HAD superfamily